MTELLSVPAKRLRGLCWGNESGLPIPFTLLTLGIVLRFWGFGAFSVAWRGLVGLTRQAPLTDAEFWGGLGFVVGGYLLGFLLVLLGRKLAPVKRQSGLHKFCYWFVRAWGVWHLLPLAALSLTAGFQNIARLHVAGGITVLLIARELWPKAAAAELHNGQAQH